MSLKLAARLVALEPTKILDLQENDTVAHTEDLSALVTDEIKAVILLIKRMAGTGLFRAYPMSGTQYQDIALSNQVICTIRNKELKWSNSVANDEWDIYLIGYFVEKRTR